MLDTHSEDPGGVQPDRASRERRRRERSAGWYVAYTKPRQEYVAQEHLQRQHFLTYLPLYKVARAARRRAGTDAGRQGGDGLSETYEPMFPRYLFFRPRRQGQSLASVRSTRGVNTIVGFGNELAVMPDHMLSAVRQAEAQRSRTPLHALAPAARPGQRVRLRDPALRGIEGLVQSVSSKRVVLLISLLGGQQAVKVKHGQIEPA